GYSKRAFVTDTWPFFHQLGAFPDYGSSYGNDINNSGQVVGSSGRAFLFTPGQGLRDLGLLPGGSGSYALGLNCFGDVAGGADVPIGEFGHVHAFLWKPSTGMVDLGLLPGGYTDAYAWDVNDSGTVLVYQSGFQLADKATLWSPLTGYFDL